MAFKGNLKEFDISGVFQFIQGHQQSGRLEIKGEKKHGYFLFNQGNIVLVWESETSINRIIIQYLLAKGQIDQDQVRYLLDMGKKNLSRLIKAIKLNKFLEKEELNQLLQNAVMDLACSLAAWEVGTYEFKPTEEEVKTIHSALVLSPEFVTLEAMRRLDEITEYKKEFDWDTILKTDEKALGGRKIQVDGHNPTKHPAVHLMVLMDGENTVYDLMRKSFLMEYGLYEVLFKLYQKKIISKVDAKDFITPKVKESNLNESVDKAVAKEIQESKLSYSVIVVLLMLLIAVCIRLLLLDGIVMVSSGGLHDPLGDFNSQRKTKIGELQYEAENGVVVNHKNLLFKSPMYLEKRDISRD